MFKSFGANEPFTSGFPYKSSTYSTYLVSCLLALAMVMGWRLFTHNGVLLPNPSSPRNISKGKHLLGILSSCFLSLALLAPILENYSLSNEKIANAFENRKQEKCKTFANLKTLNISGVEIVKNEKVFSKSVDEFGKAIGLNFSRPSVTSKQEVFYFSIKAKEGATISLQDLAGLPQSVTNLTLPGRSWSSLATNEISLRRFFDEKQYLLDGIFIYPSDYSQIISFSVKSQLAKDLVFRVNAPSNFSISPLRTANLISLKLFVGDVPTFVIPPLVTNFSCISNKQFDNSELIMSLNIIQDSAMWFRQSDKNTFDNIIENLNSYELPIYGTRKPGLFSLLQIQPYATSMK
jgi:hypothetical protein